MLSFSCSRMFFTFWAAPAVRVIMITGSPLGAADGAALNLHPKLSGLFCEGSDNGRLPGGRFPIEPTPAPFSRSRRPARAARSLGAARPGWGLLPRIAEMAGGARRGRPAPRDRERGRRRAGLDQGSAPAPDAARGGA